MGLWLIRNNNVLLLSRIRDAQETWGVITGKLEECESIPQAAVREAYEEAGVMVKTEDIVFKHVVVDQLRTGVKMIGFHFMASHWEGEPYNKEPEEHIHMQWFSLDALPATFLKVHQQVAQKIRENSNYSDHVLD